MLPVALAFALTAAPVEPPSEVRRVVVHVSDHDVARQRLERIGIVGASASSGFATGLPTRWVIAGALRVREKVKDASTVRHFMDAHKIGGQQITEVLEHDPTVVFATDFLFWYASGSKSLTTRKGDLSHAFEQLERFDCPVFVGDLPDVHGADERMISEDQIVPEADRRALNEMIHAWADSEDDIHLVPLSGWYDIARNGGSVDIDGSTFELAPGQALRRDRLHPSRIGQVMLGLLVLQHFDAAFPGLEEDELRLDPYRLWRRHAPFSRRPRRVGDD